MPKVNAVLMAVLSLALIGGLGAFVLRNPGAATADGSLEKTLRKLADPDPDLRREAEGEIRAMGPRGKDALRDAARSSDRTLADRASKLLAELEPPAPKKAPVPDTPEGELIEFQVMCSGAPERASQNAIFMIQLVNRSSTPLLVALQKAGAAEPIAWFEAEFEGGAVEKIPAEPLEGEEAAIYAVPPGGAPVLYGGWKTLREVLARTDARKVRFVYDASEGSAYRRLVQPSEKGVLLPPRRFTSRTYTLAD